MPFHGALPPPGSTNITLQNCCKCLESSGEVNLNGENAPAQFHWVAMRGPSHTGTIPLQLGLSGTSSFLMQLLAARWLFFLGTLMK